METETKDEGIQRAKLWVMLGHPAPYTLSNL
jgi:hypothetical protein